MMELNKKGMPFRSVMQIQQRLSEFVARRTLELGTSILSGASVQLLYSRINYLVKDRLGERIFYSEKQ